MWGGEDRDTQIRRARENSQGRTNDKPFQFEKRRVMSSACPFRSSTCALLLIPFLLSDERKPREVRWFQHPGGGGREGGRGGCSSLKKNMATATGREEVGAVKRK